ncbi:RpiR family transcriptional regulator [Escherichia coli]|nr:RpiR family transcriptional regulator [Escherichia coli]
MSQSEFDSALPNGIGLAPDMTFRVKPESLILTIFFLGLIP